MFNNVVVGVDGGEGGADAVALAERLCREGGRISLVFVYPGEAGRHHSRYSEFDQAQRARGQRLLEKARDDAGIEADLRLVPSPSVGRGLHEVAEADEADLLVVASSRRGLLGRVFISNDTRAALNGAPCAVAIAPAGYREYPRTMREIGVGYDGSAESQHALAFARGLADDLDTKLSAFQAVSIPTYYANGLAAVDGSTIPDLVNNARDELAALGGVEAHAAYGNAAEELSVYSASLDLLVIGSRSYGPFGRLVHGSTAQGLAGSARCPLLVLTRGARESGAATPERERETSDVN
jgi:nucleotide-binding universal stress UspA family protein